MREEERFFDDLFDAHNVVTVRARGKGEDEEDPAAAEEELDRAELASLLRALSGKKQDGGNEEDEAKAKRLQQAEEEVDAVLAVADRSGTGTIRRDEMKAAVEAWWVSAVGMRDAQ